MHLHQLKVKNLASLRGDHVVDFDVLAGQDLFAITGETGAGKSTLLNAVALALYGRVYKSQLNQTDLVTLGEREAAIELTFSVRGVKHLAKWSIAVRKKNGEPLKAPSLSRYIYVLPPGGEPQVLEKKAEEILAMDFDQFSKCVILNQGEFARFLTAGFAERRDILERLYPSDNLELVGGLAKKKFETVQERLQRLDVQVHSLNEETLFDVDAARASEQKWLEALKSTQERLQSLRPWAQGLDELKSFASKHAEAKTKLSAASETLSTRTQENNLAMTAASTHQKHLEQFEAELEKVRPTLEAHDLEARNLDALAATLREKSKLAADKDKTLGDLTQRLAGLELERSESDKQLKDLEQRLKFPHASQWEKVPWSAWEKWERDWPLSVQQKTTLDEQLTVLTKQGQQLAVQEAELKQRQQEFLALLHPELRPLAAAERAQKLRQWRETQVRLGQQEKERQTLTVEFHALSAERQHAQAELEKLKLAAENEALRFALHQVESLLGKGHDLAACPLCQQSLAEAQWQALKQTWPRALSSNAQEQFEEAKRRDEKRETQLQLLQTRLKALSSPSETIVDLAPQEELHEKLSHLHVELGSIEKRLQDSRAQWKLLSERQQEAQRKSEELTALQSRLLVESSETLGITLTWSAGLLAELRTERDQVRVRDEKQRARVKLTEQLQQQQQDKAKLLAELTELTQQIKVQQEDHLARQKVLSALYPGSTPQAILKAKTEEWRSLTSKQQLLQNEHRQKELLLSEARSQLGRVQEQLQQLELLFAELSSRLNQTRSISVTIQEAERVLTPLFTEVSEEIKREEQAALHASEESSKLKTLLQEDQKRREKKALFEAQQQEARKDSERWKRLLDVLGADDMRTYVLSLVEAALIQQTNFELQKLCSGRYEIQHNAKKGKLVPEFWVIDRWRDGLLRKVTTLSGGETFMVSLAMALALAEMARGRADIDSFFIDEGFGTLDEDSLEDVMDMLQQVRSRGKQIGLITHVKALSSRLPLNLRVSKDARGNSNVSVVWN